MRNNLWCYYRYLIISNTVLEKCKKECGISGTRFSSTENCNYLLIS